MPRSKTQAPAMPAAIVAPEGSACADCPLFAGGACVHYRYIAVELAVAVPHIVWCPHRPGGPTAADVPPTEPDADHETHQER